MSEIVSKICSECKADKLFSEFRRAAKGKHGVAAICKRCFSAKYAPSRQTPEQKAVYLRRTGAVSSEYIPRVEKMRISSEKRVAQSVETARLKAARTEERKTLLASLHNQHVRAYRASGAAWRVRYQQDTAFAIKQRLRTQLRKKAKLHPKLDDLMRNAINRRGQSHTVEVVCGYRITELVAHLESLFVDGMDWAAFMRGEIHIDHKRPQASFDLLDEHQVRACWALSNLQPLWARDNLAKGKRWDERQAA